MKIKYLKYNMYKKGFLNLFIIIIFILARKENLCSQDTCILRGKVLNQSGVPVSNVSISVEGSLQEPVFTDGEGKFEINIGSGNKWLIINPIIEYKKKRIYINNRQYIKIYLTPEDLISGYDMMPVLQKELPRRNVVASYSELLINKLYKYNSYTVDQLFQGNISGINSILRSSMPGSGASSIIRGVKSIYTNNQPLYIVDGLPILPFNVFNNVISGSEYNPLLSVNYFDISKIYVFKDPLYSSMYGIKGSNGIIFIETLDPSATKTEIEVDYKSILSLFPERIIPQLNADEHRALMSEILFTSGKLEEDIKEEYPGLFYDKYDKEYINYIHNTNWQKLIFRNSVSNFISVKVKGGDEIARYGLSVGYKKGNGIFKNTSFDAFNLRFVSRVNIFRWLKMNAGVSANAISSRLKESAISKEASPILSSLFKSPILNPYKYDDEGNETKIIAEVDELGVSNPVAIINNYLGKNNSNEILANLNLIGNVTKNLLLNTRLCFSYNLLKESYFMPNHGMELYYDGEAYNIAKIGNNEYLSIYNNTFLSYNNKSLNNKHYFNYVTGFHISNNKYQFDWALTKNSHENDQYSDLQSGKDYLRELGGNNRIWNWISYYNSLNYRFMDKYLIDFVVSLDGSSRIGKDAKELTKIGDWPFGLSYSGGFAWRISEENFLKNSYWIEDFKIRLSAGVSGNDDIGEINKKKYYNPIKYRSTAGFYPAIYPNNEITYEKTFMLNGGFDFAMFSNKLILKLDVYRSITSNLLEFTPLEAYIGYDYLAENVGKVENKGVDVEFFYRILRTKNLIWDLSLNFSTLKNKILKLNNKYITSISGGEIANIEGYPLNSFYGYIYKGVFSTQEEADRANLINNKGIKFNAGDAIYEDISGPTGVPDGIINEYDKTFIGSSLPKFYGGIINEFRYKRFSMSILLYFVEGNKVFNYVRYMNERMTGLENQSTRVANRWQYEGQITEVPRALWKDPIGNSAFSTRWIEDGSFFRVKNITLSYKLREGTLNLKGAELYFAVNNIYTYSKYLGYDPEFCYSFNQLYNGIDYGMMPQTKEFLFGFKINL